MCILNRDTHIRYSLKKIQSWLVFFQKIEVRPLSNDADIQNIVQEYFYNIVRIFCNHRQPMRLNTLDEICKSQNRAINLTRKHMEENGWVSKEYLIKQHGKDDKFIDDVYEEVQRLVRKQLITGDID